MSSIELCREVNELIGQELPVSVHRDIDVRVAEVMLDRLGMDRSG